MDMISKTPRQ